MAESKNVTPDTKYATHDLAKAAGNFSRRNRTTAAHFAHRDKWDTFKTPEGHAASAKIRQEERDKLTPAQQLKVLNERLGKGLGAEKERARLQKAIEKAKAVEVEAKVTEAPVEKPKEKKSKGKKS